MEYYPIKQLLKNAGLEKERTQPQNATLKFAKSLDVSNDESPARGEASLPGIYPNSLSQSPMKRHDRVFTLSWAKKQDERRKEYLSNNTSPEPSKILSPTIVSPLNRKNRRFVTHLSSKMDNEVFRVPLYEKEKDVFDIREQNARILKQIISNKHSHQVEFNKVAEENHFKQFRSSPLMKSPKSLLDDKSIGSSILTRNQRQSNHSMQISILRTENSKTIGGEDMDEVASHTIQPDLPSWTTLSPARLRPEKSPTLLEGLEEIYQGDLRKRSKEREKSNRLNSKSFSEIDKDALKLRNFKDYYQDDKLMKRLEDPYAKSLPFEKPVVGGFRQNKLRELQAIETKAEVLRNIKFIDDSIAKDALPQIQENPNEEANLDTKREEKKKAKAKKDGRTMKLWAKHMATSKAKVMKEVNNKEI